MALARLAADHQRSGAAGIIALTIDHGLRVESTEEAAQTAAWCRAAGLNHETLRWTGVKPTAGVQEAARNARYKLLCDAALKHHCSAILTAHTSDDQAETVFMRMARGAGPRGLSAMASSSMIANGAREPVGLLRPFLGVTRNALKATLKNYEQDYVSDPGNDDPAFERIRARALLAALTEQGHLSREALLLTAERSRQAVFVMEREEQRSFNRAGGVFHHWGGVELNASFLQASSASLLLRQVIFAVSGSGQPPRENQVSGAINDLQASGAATLAGAVMRNRNDKVWVYREPAALLGRAGVAPVEPMRVGAGERRLWDGRLAVQNLSDQSLSLAPMGADAGNAVRMEEAPSDAVRSVPVVVNEDELLVSGRDYVLKSLAQERFFRRVNRFQ